MEWAACCTRFAVNGKMLPKKSKAQLRSDAPSQSDHKEDPSVSLSRAFPV
jgi:hypothetical protein